MATLVTSFTRIKLDVKDFEVGYELTAEGINISIRPKTKYGSFAMQEIFDAECASEIVK